MLLLEKAALFKLDHRACSVRGGSSQPLFAAAGDGSVSVCRLGPRHDIERVPGRRKTGLICPHPSNPCWR
jgi:hypothetical protein